MGTIVEPCRTAAMGMAPRSVVGLGLLVPCRTAKIRPPCWHASGVIGPGLLLSGLSQTARVPDAERGAKPPDPVTPEPDDPTEEPGRADAILRAVLS
jgi:hypothetical protein